MEDTESPFQSGTMIPPELDYPPSVTTAGLNTQCVTMLKMRLAAGDRVQLPQVLAPLLRYLHM
jgi:hypothetical protein